MKRLMTMMTTVATLVAVLPLAAATETVDGTSWGYEDVYDDYGEPTGGVVVSPADQSSISGRVVIPSRLGGKPVTCLSVGAFFGCSGLSDVVIPGSVTSISFFAFEQCSGLTSVTIPGTVRHIEDFAFCDCSGLTSMEIQNGVTSIGQAVFGCCKKMTNITIPGSVTSIKYQAFYECLGLRNMTIPSSVMDIGEGLFENCKNLESVTLPMWCKNTSKNWASYLRLQSTAKIVYKDVQNGGTSGDSSGGTVPEAWKKARTLRGVVTRALPSPRDVQGVFDLKCGKANKQGVAKVSATLTGLDGKKRSYKAQNVNVTGETVTVNLGGLNITIDGDTFGGGENLPGGLSVRSAGVGGNWTGSGATVTVDASDLSMFGGTVLTDLLPDGERASVAGGKWKFAKAAGVKWAKPKGTALPEIYDEGSGKGLVVDTSAGKANLSAMKLTYTPKKGTFKGSFKVYALEGEGQATKLKKYTVKVSGVVVGGVGYGMASCSRPGLTWSVMVK